jgi:hypothetical protein
MHKSATKCNETIGKWCKNKHGASKIIDTLETYHLPPGRSQFPLSLESSTSRPRAAPPPALLPQPPAPPSLSAPSGFTRAAGQPPVPPASQPRRRATARSHRPAVQPPAPGPPPCPRATPALGVRSRWRTGAGGASALGITRE